MRRVGIWIVVLAVGSALLPLIGLQFILLKWVDIWGPEIAWVIRGVLVALGAVLIVAGSRKAAAASPAPSQPGK